MRPLNPECSVEGCGQRMYSKPAGLCSTHYQRQRRIGSVILPGRPTLEERFWSKVIKDGPIPEHRPDLGPCWTWTGYISPETGYAYFSLDHAHPVLAHRQAYTLTNGPIPDGLILDHLCRNRPCPNPGHSEPVTYQENLLRGPTTLAAQNVAKTHCPHGHPYDEANTYFWKDGSRHCRACSREKRRAWRARQKRSS